ncbi:ash family protein [Yersinia enterocolitica]|uniref:ash family protein n=1 Tax=Yersinia enterocolitica TaxID=630 RepID=UPI00370968E3
MLYRIWQSGIHQSAWRKYGYIVNKQEMVSWAGASKDAPDSLLTGSSNPAQFTTHKEIGTSRW